MLGALCCQPVDGRHMLLAASSASCSRSSLPSNLINGQELTICDIVWVSPQSHSSLSVKPHFWQHQKPCRRLCTVEVNRRPQSVIFISSWQHVQDCSRWHQPVLCRDGYAVYTHTFFVVLAARGCIKINLCNFK